MSHGLHVQHERLMHLSENKTLKCFVNESFIFFAHRNAL
ncbi:hypothetical protein CSC15_0014 [Escherichia coli]|nr:hypothetical protein CSC15_0014 [Escherichia coli]